MTDLSYLRTGTIEVFGNIILINTEKVKLNRRHATTQVVEGHHRSTRLYRPVAASRGQRQARWAGAYVTGAIRHSGVGLLPRSYELEWILWVFWAALRPVGADP
jgi:hypothetical protein